MLLAFQEYQLRHKHPTVIMNILPPMQIMEDLLIRIIAVGFFILSLSLATGFMFLHDIFAQHLIHKTVCHFYHGWSLHYFYGSAGTRAGAGKNLSAGP